MSINHYRHSVANEMIITKSSVFLYGLIIKVGKLTPNFDKAYLRLDSTHYGGMNYLVLNAHNSLQALACMWGWLMFYHLVPWADPALNQGGGGGESHTWAFVLLKYFI